MKTLGDKSISALPSLVK